MDFYNLTSIKILGLKYPDIYFSENYGKACEFSDDAIWELCKFKDLIYIYLKKPIEYNNIIYYDLITPYGYSGFYYDTKETYKEFIPLFREKAKERNYITEVLRQNPYLDINITNYDVITQKTVYTIDLQNLKEQDYLKFTAKSNRKMINKAIKNNLEFKILEYNQTNLKFFKAIYDQTMNNLNSKNYYYFNEKYYQTLDNCFIANVYYNEILCSSCIIFKYDKFLHYHIGGSLLEYRHFGSNNYLHYNVIKYGIENNYKLYVLGGGLKDGDTLSKFKEKLSTKQFNYVIYKNIINNEIYEKLTDKFCKNKEIDYFPKYKY